MSKFKHVTLAMDLSLNGPGFAVVAVEPTSGKPIILDARSLVLTRHTSHGAKLSATAALITELYNTYKPQHIVREKGFSRFAATTQALFKVVGVSDYVLYNAGHTKHIDELSPTTVKKTVAGNGKASKDDVKSAVMRYLQVEDAKYFANEDESDAAAVALTHLAMIGVITL